MPLTIRKTFLFTQAQPILDALIVEMPGGTRLLALDENRVAVYRQQAGRWELESSLPISHSHIFPRDPRGRLLLRHDRLFDAYLPGTLCRSSAAAPLTMTCSDSDDPWPLAIEEGGVRAFSRTTLMLGCERSEPRSIPQDKARLLHQTLRGPPSAGTSG